MPITASIATSIRAAKLQEDMAIYYGMVSFMDQQIGHMLAAVDRLGVADDTLLIFTTDHGHFLGQHGLIAKGAFHYEDLLRLPFIVRWPGHVLAGATNEALTALIDLAPTFLSAAGIPVPDRCRGSINWKCGADGPARCARGDRRKPAPADALICAPISTSGTK